MASRDVSQLILRVDAQVATAQRSLNQLARAVQQDSTQMETALGKVSSAHARMGKALNDNGRVRGGLTQLSFQIGDVTQQMSLGVRASTIFAQQSGQVIQALQIMGGEGNKFLRFLGGPWGIAISTAAVVLGSLIPKLLEGGDATGDLVDKMREQAEQAKRNRKADEAWKTTIEGLTEAIRTRREEQEKARKSDVTAELESFNAAEGELTTQAANLNKKAADLDAAVAKLQNARTFLKLVEGTEFQRGALQAVLQAEEKVKTLRGEVQGVVSDVRTAQQNLRGAQAAILRREAEGAVDPLKKSSDQIAFEIDQLTEKFINGQVGPAAYRKEIERLTKALKDAHGASSEAGKQFGRQIDFTQAEDIARNAGLQVNSGFRSNAEQAALFNDPSVNRPGNPVAPPGASAHNGARGKWAIDIQITDGVTPAKIREIFADQGVSLTKVLKEKGHFHIEGSRSDAAGAENEQDRAQTLAVRQQNRFEEQRDRLNEELLRAQNDLVQGVDAEADAAEDTVRAQQARRDSAYQNDVEEKKLTQAEADQLKAINATVAAAKIRAIEIDRQVGLIKQQDEARQRRFGYDIDDLRFADEMATTQAAHRRIQLEILDVVYKQKEAHLKALKAELDLAGKIEEAAGVQAEIDRLPTEKAQDRQRTLKGTMNPLEALADQAPKTAEEVNAALQSIEARGLDSLADAITDIITGTESLGKAFGNVARSIIADIIQMTVRMLIFRALSSALGGGGGSVIPITNGTMLIEGTRAGGGPVRAGGTYLVGEKGPELFTPSTSGTIIPNSPRVVVTANNNTAGPVEVLVTVAASPELDARVEEVSARTVGRAAPVIVKAAVSQTIKVANRPTLMGRR